jgi:hypothetical protein
MKTGDVVSTGAGSGSRRAIQGSRGAGFQQWLSGPRRRAKHRAERAEQPEAIASQPNPFLMLPVVDRPARIAGTGPVTPDSIGQAMEQGERLADRPAAGLQAVAPMVGHLEVSIQTGNLAGLVCSVKLHCGRLRCQLHADAAALRRELRGRGQRVANRLARNGFALDSFEVSR